MRWPLEYKSARQKYMVQQTERNIRWVRTTVRNELISSDTCRLKLASENRKCWSLRGVGREKKKERKKERNLEWETKMRHILSS